LTISAINHRPREYTEEEYTILLGIPTNNVEGTKFIHKSKEVRRAYQFATKQYEVMRQDRSLSQEEAFKIVDNLLKQGISTQQVEARKRSKEAKELAKTRKEETTAAKPPSEEPKKNALQISPADPEARHNTHNLEGTVPSMLTNKPRAARGMQLWAQRLQAVPYTEWTIGAVTALDHWIARNILALEGDVWELCLAREARQSLFPETLSSMCGEEDSDLGPPVPTAASGIDQLLNTLASMENTDDSEPPSSDLLQTANIMNMTMSDVEKWTLDLQDWRATNIQEPYEKWSEKQKTNFDVSELLKSVFGFVRDQFSHACAILDS